jgi:ATP-dependent Lon protease
LGKAVEPRRKAGKGKAGKGKTARGKPRQKGPEEAEAPAIPAELGIIPLRDTVIFPYMIAPLVIGRTRSLRLVDEASNSDRTVGLATQTRPDTENPVPADLHTIGTAATILKMLKFPDGSTRILVQGNSRIKIKGFSQEEPYIRARVEPVPETSDSTVETQALLRTISEIFGKIVALSPHLPDELQVAVMNIDNPSRAADLIASNINLTTQE